MINKQRKSIYPEYEHIQLLKACILEGDSAIEAWQNWDRVTNINDIDNASMRLLPSLYLTLRDNNIHTDYTNKIKGVYRRTLVKNKILFNSLIDIQKSFKKYNIEVMLLKGGALILNNNYKDPYQRPMSDIDLLIKPEDEIRAKDLLQESGWDNVYQFNKYSNPLVGRLNYYKKPNMEIDLHWYLLFEGPDINIDRELWTTSSKVKFANTAISVLNPTFQLMHVCIHGVIWSGSYPLRWIIDATSIINSNSNIDWKKLIFQTKVRRMTVPMYTALKILEDSLHIYIPKDILQQLKDSGTILERLWYNFAKRKHMPLFGGFIRNYFKYLLFFKHRFKICLNSSGVSSLILLMDSGSSLIIE